MCDDSFDMLINDNDFSKIHKYARKFIAPKVDDILLVDNRSVDWYQQNFGKGIWLPIMRDEKKEIPLYKEALVISKQFIEKYKLEGKKVLLYVGRLVGLKNLSRLIAAIGKTKADFVTVIVGDGEEAEYLKSEAALVDKPIIFAGHFENHEIRAWYNVSDVFVLPSVQEAFGAVTNEALIAGNYCLISKVAGSSCLINNLNGKIFNPIDVDEIANLIDNTMEQVKKDNQINNVKDSLMPFTFRDMINNVINILKS